LINQSSNPVDKRSFGRSDLSKAALASNQSPARILSTQEQKAELVRAYQDNVTRLFDPYIQIHEDRYQAENYGLNHCASTANQEESKVDPVALMTPETHRVLKALNNVPLIKQTDTLNYLQGSRYGQSGVTEGVRINSEICLTPQTAQPSLIAHFDQSAESESFFLTEDHQREFKAGKGHVVPNVRPQGLLVTTLYEHRNPVNTVDVTDD